MGGLPVGACGQRWLGPEVDVHTQMGRHMGCMSFMCVLDLGACWRCLLVQILLSHHVYYVQTDLTSDHMSNTSMGITDLKSELVTDCS